MTSEPSDKVKVKEESPTLPTETSEEATTQSTGERKVVIVTPADSDHKDSNKKLTKKNKHSRFLPKPKK